MKRLICALILLASPSIFAAGFEIPENTTRSVARGGTGVASKHDPSALYFNPALLSRAPGLQVLLDLNLVDLSLDFERDPLTVGSTTRTFSRVSNQEGFFPAPFFAASYDFGIDGLGVGIGVFGPSAYGKRCFGKTEDCEPSDDNGARLMILNSELLQIYFTAGASYEFSLGSMGSISIGAAAALAYQRNNFEVVIDELLVSPPFDEDPNNQAPLTASNLEDFKPTGFFGLAYFNGPLTVGVSYRPPISWSDEGELDITMPDAYKELVALKGNRLKFDTNQAGQLRAGIDLAHGQHPGIETEPLFDLEFNFVWEDWSRVDYFTIAPDAVLEISGVDQPLFVIYQPKHWQDTFSFRLGGSVGVVDWLTLHAGTSYETAAQDDPATSVDFVSWERLTGGAGATVHATKWLDVSLAYAYTYSGSRDVTNGQVYQQIPVSGCVGPDFTAEACKNPGSPPGNPQNNGHWESAFQILSVGTTFKFDP